MKNWPAYLLVVLSVCSCAPKSELVRFWETHSIDYSDIDAAQEQFADFAELCVSAPEEEALAAMDVLFDQLKKDEVGYYIYTDWIDGAFYNILSPCRNAAIYSKAAERVVKDAVVSFTDRESFIKKREWISYNLPGSQANVPSAIIRERCVVLVLDQGCPSCRTAIDRLSSDWADTRRIAVCCGYGPMPTDEGWEFIQDRSEAIFDPNMTPVFFVVSADGTVERPYSPIL